MSFLMGQTLVPLLAEQDKFCIQDQFFLGPLQISDQIELQKSRRQALRAHRTLTWSPTWLQRFLAFSALNLEIAFTPWHFLRCNIEKLFIQKTKSAFLQTAFLHCVLVGEPRQTEQDTPVSTVGGWLDTLILLLPESSSRSTVSHSWSGFVWRWDGFMASSHNYLLLSPVYCKNCIVHIRRSLLNVLM